MKNPSHPGLSVRADCLEPHGLSVTDGAKVLGVTVCIKLPGERECSLVLGYGYSLGQGVWRKNGPKKIKVKIFSANAVCV